MRSPRCATPSTGARRTWCASPTWTGSAGLRVYGYVSASNVEQFNTSATVNDLTLKVTSPNGSVYWGNNGLLAGNWSTAGGSANTVDTAATARAGARASSTSSRPASNVWTTMSAAMKPPSAPPGTIFAVHQARGELLRSFGCPLGALGRVRRRVSRAERSAARLRDAQLADHGRQAVEGLCRGL